MQTKPSRSTRNVSLYRKEQEYLNKFRSKHWQLGISVDMPVPTNLQLPLNSNWANNLLTLWIGLQALLLESIIKYCLFIVMLILNHDHLKCNDISPMNSEASLTFCEDGLNVQ